MKIRKGDNVLVIKGRDRGRQGRVVQSFPKANSVQVEGVNVVKRHAKATSTVTQAGIIEKEMPLHISNIMLVNPITNLPDRVGIKKLEDGTKVRFFKSNNEVVDI